MRARDEGTRDQQVVRAVAGDPAPGGSGGTVGSGGTELLLAYGPPSPRTDLLRLWTGCLALLAVLAVFVVGLLGEPGAGSGLQAALELAALACVAFAGWVLPGAVRRMRARRQSWREPSPVLRLTREGVEFQSREGGYVVFAPWSLVERCEFRPAPGGEPRWCIDAPRALAPSLSFAAAWAGMVPSSQVDDRVGELAATWIALGTPADRGLLRDALLYGTPIVMDLVRCPGVTVTQLDAAVRSWTFGRCGCDPKARPRRWHPQDAEEPPPGAATRDQRSGDG